MESQVKAKNMHCMRAWSGLFQDSAFKLWMHLREVNGSHSDLSRTFDMLCPFKWENWEAIKG